MPTKRNRAGNQQPYVPEGNGDASGEYADGDGINVNYKPKESGTSIKETPKETTIIPKAKPTPKKEKPQNQPVAPKSEDYTNGTPAEREKLKEKGISTITEEMKSPEYTKNKFTTPVTLKGYFSDKTFEPKVSITRGSLSKDEVGEFNSYLQEMFDKYPDMQKFTNITVKNAKKSSQGGYFKRVRTGYGGEQMFDLYINAGWLDEKSSKENLEENLEFYKNRLGEYNKDNPDHQSWINVYERRIKEIQQDIENGVSYTSCGKLTGRSAKLNNLVSHELMHYMYYHNVKSLDLDNEITTTFWKAKDNGDAKRISTYATTSKQEFISEAYASMRTGLKVPEYIQDLVNKILTSKER